MDKAIDYYYSLISPWTYMGGPRLEEIAARHGATIAYKPIKLSEIFPASGGLPLAKRAPARQAYRLAELERWRTFLDMPLNMHPKHFPTPEWPAAGMVIAAHHPGPERGRLTNALLRAVWVEERDISDRETLQVIAGENSMDGNALLAHAEGGAANEEYQANTAEAMALGVFGAPTYVYGGELFWGQDRLDFLDRALARP
ncbi:MAG: 2-hydroxychromene-2-carboxylate isomerase [Rhodospirillales bacterium]|jgi:2-hydroxychromene-2-carboxylate isomerase|nr:2-hydroxychromene-2-carboxylate isomerase [Rhodospirillales bacterium]MDP6788776.1 2-hydroxychromene-2-carboxylate isomerase [Rhodospirillales bacterium]